jgi:valyl-tRNA synthetase
MPFITEELWHSLAERGEDETIMYQPSPVAGPVDEKVINDFEYARETVVAVRGIRQQKNIPPKEALGLKVKGGEFPAGISPLVEKLSNVASVEQVASFDGFGAGVSAMVRTVELFIPISGMVDRDEELRKLEADLDYQRGFLAGVRKKLSNESFVAHAPEKVVALERKKEADSLSKIESLENAIKALKNS